MCNSKTEKAQRIGGHRSSLPHILNISHLSPLSPLQRSILISVLIISAQTLKYPPLWSPANSTPSSTMQPTETHTHKSDHRTPLITVLQWLPIACQMKSSAMLTGSPTHNPPLPRHLLPPSRDFVFEDYFPWYCRSTSSILLLLFTSFHLLKHSFLSVFNGKILVCAFRSRIDITFVVSLLISSDWLCAL